MVVFPEMLLPILNSQHELEIVSVLREVAARETVHIAVTVVTLNDNTGSEKRIMNKLMLIDKHGQEPVLIHAKRFIQV